MKKLILLLLIIPIVSLGQSGKIKKVAKKLDVFINTDKIQSVSVIDDTNSGLEANLNRYLIKYGFETFSRRAAEQRIAEIELNKNKVTIDGPATFFESQIVIVISGISGKPTELFSASFEIIDLNQNGKIIGGASYSSSIGGRSASVIAEAFSYGLSQNLK